MRLATLSVSAVILAFVVSGCAADANEEQASGEAALSPPTMGWNLGTYEGPRASAPGKTALLEAQKFTYSDNSRFTLHAAFVAKTDDEGAGLASDLLQMNFDLTLDEFNKLFEWNGEVKIDPQFRARDPYVEHAEASTRDGVRKVVLRWDNSNDRGDAKGEMEFALGRNNDLTSFRMTKSVRSGGAWKSVFDDEVSAPKFRYQGLALYDDFTGFGYAILGHVVLFSEIRSAISGPTPLNFRRLITPPTPAPCP